MFRNLKYAFPVIIAVTLTGCAGGDLQSSNHLYSEQQAASQAQQFFSAHPEYLRSADAEAELFSLFKTELREDRSHKSMGDLLNAAHAKLQLLNSFKNGNSRRS